MSLMIEYLRNTQFRAHREIRRKTPPCYLNRLDFERRISAFAGEDYRVEWTLEDSDQVRKRAAGPALFSLSDVRTAWTMTKLKPLLRLLIGPCTGLYGSLPTINRLYLLYHGFKFVSRFILRRWMMFFSIDIKGYNL